MRKKAQERKGSSPPPSPSSSSSNPSSTLRDPPLEAGVGKHEVDSVEEGTSSMTGFEGNEEDAKGYPMDQIWSEIAALELISELSFEGYKNEACINVSCPLVPSPACEYCSDSLWKIDDEEFTMLATIGDNAIREES